MTNIIIISLYVTKIGTTRDPMMLIPPLNRDLVESFRHPGNLVGTLCYSLNNAWYFLIKPPIYGWYNYDYMQIIDK